VRRSNVDIHHREMGGRAITLFEDQIKKRPTVNRGPLELRVENPFPICAEAQLPGAALARNAAALALNAVALAQPDAVALALSAVALASPGATP
jgi:hypothetical protein